MKTTCISCLQLKRKWDFAEQKTAAFAINPDIAVAVDVTDTGDTPSAPTMAIELGKGTAIKVMDRSIMCDADVRTMMIETAKKKQNSVSA